MVNIPVNHKDPGTLSESSKSKVRVIQKRTHGKLASLLLGSCTQTHARRWRHTLTPQLDPSTQGGGTWARYNRMAGLGSSQSLDVPYLEGTVYYS